MSMKASLRSSAPQAALFALVFAALSLVGDRWWQRDVDPVQTALATVIAAGLFWLMIAYRRKVKSR